MPRPFLALLLPALLASASGPSAAAGTLKVPGDHPTIQAAVDAAGTGDVVKVSAGTYVENVVVAVDGLVLTAVGEVVVDARADGAEGTGAAISVIGSGVTIEGITVRHALAIVDVLVDGFPTANIDVLATATDCTLVDVVSEHPAEAHLSATATGLVVKGCTFRGEGLIGVSESGATIESCTFRQVGSVQLFGADAVVRKNRFETCAAGLLISADGAVVQKNRLEGCAELSIVVQGENATVERNEVRSGGGILVTGSGATIRKNRLFDVTFPITDVIPALGLAGATGGTIEANVIDGSSTAGIQVTPDCTLVNVVGNVVKDVRSHRGSVLTFGIATPLPFAAIFVEGSTNAVLSNSVRRSAGDGFLITGGLNLVAENSAIDCLEDGFDVEGDGNLLDGNVAKRCRAESFENNGDGTTFTNNEASKGRVPYANDGTFAEFTGNAPDVGAAAPEIDY